MQVVQKHAHIRKQYDFFFSLLDSVPEICATVELCRTSKQIEAFIFFVNVCLSPSPVPVLGVLKSLRSSVVSRTHVLALSFGEMGCCHTA